jgi:hypothetical protein
MRRREFIAFLGTGLTLPATSHGQHISPTRIGLVHSGTPEASADAVAAFREGLAKSGA